MTDRFGKDTLPLRNKKLFLLDIDGTIYLGDRLFDGICELLSTIKSAGGDYVFITNNSSESVNEYVKKFQRLGIKEISEDNFFTSAQAAALLFREKYSDKLIYVQGSSSFVSEIRGEGLRVTEDACDGIGAVLVGYDTALTAVKMETTCRILTEQNIPYYATNPDWVCPTAFGYVPDCGSMCEGYFRATGKRPMFIGKPEPMMIDIVAKRKGVPKSDILVVGDRLYTDIAAGIAAGVDTLCVLSGEATLNDIILDEEKPTYTLDSITDIYK